MFLRHPPPFVPSPSSYRGLRQHVMRNLCLTRTDEASRFFCFGSFCVQSFAWLARSYPGLNLSSEPFLSAAQIIFFSAPGTPLSYSGLSYSGRAHHLQRCVTSGSDPDNSGEGSKSIDQNRFTIPRWVLNVGGVVAAFSLFDLGNKKQDEKKLRPRRESETFAACALISLSAPLPCCPSRLRRCP